MVAIDGCNVGCAKAVLTHAEIPLKHYFILEIRNLQQKGFLAGVSMMLMRIFSACMLMEMVVRV